MLEKIDDESLIVIEWLLLYYAYFGSFRGGSQGNVYDGSGDVFRLNFPQHSSEFVARAKNRQHSQLYSNS